MSRPRIGIFIAIVSLLTAAFSCDKEIEVLAVRLSESSVTLNVGETATLLAIVEPPVADYDRVSWSSSDPSVATVENGVVRVLKAGTATITASAGGVMSRACVITADEPVVEVVEPAGPEASAGNVETAVVDEPEVTDPVVSAPAEPETTTEPETPVEPVAPAETVAPVDPTEVSGTDDNLVEGTSDKEADGQGVCFIYDVDFGEEGSFIDIDSLVTVTDWRGRNFNENPGYWNYYGPFEFTVDIKNAECDMNGERQALPQSVTLIQTAAGATSVADPTTGSATTLPANRHGFLMVKFSTVGLTEPFNIYVKIRVKYGFGTIQTDWITIPVVKVHPAD